MLSHPLKIPITPPSLPPSFSLSLQRDAITQTCDQKRSYEGRCKRWNKLCKKTLLNS